MSVRASPFFPTFKTASCFVGCRPLHRLFAVNHALSAASDLGIAVKALFAVGPFETNALQAGLGDAPENLVQPGGANYDWSVLHHNLQLAGLASHPLPPDSMEWRCTDFFGDHNAEGQCYTAAAYILRTPQCGGHWVALLPPSVLSLQASGSCAAVLCDSLQSEPFVLTTSDTDDLLTACALEGVCANSGFGNALTWGAFLITAPARAAV